MRNLPKDYQEKKWIIQEWAPYRNKMLELLRTQELIKASSNKDVFYWFDSHTNNLTSDDDYFFRLITAPKIKKCLLSHHPDFFRDIDSFRHLMTEGALFVATKAEATANQTDDTCFLLPRDNRHMFYLGQNKAKFFVLDGTADIDPDYKINYVQLIDASSYNVRLPLTINHIDVPTSRSIIVNKNRTFTEEQHILLRQEVLSHLDEQTSDHTLAVTYKDIENSVFPEDAYEQQITKGHFGGLRGKNEFRTLTHMDLIGFLRLSDLSYYIKYLIQHPEELDKLRTMGESQSRLYIKERLNQVNGTFVMPELNEIMFGDILSDFEQNIFRLAIRNYDNTEPVIVHTYWNCVAYAKLNQMISDRYSPYCVQIFHLGKPAAFEQRKTEKRKASGDKAQTGPQKILDWAKAQLPGRKITVADIRKEAGLTVEEFKNTKKNKAVKGILANWKTEQDGVYVVR